MSSAPAPSPVPAPSRPPNQPIAPASSNNSQPRVRTQGGRKKAAPLIEPDALYRAEPASAHLAGSKRTAQEKPEGEPRKRKRVEHTSVFHAQQHAVANAPSPAVSATSANASSAKQQQQAVASNASNNRQQVIGPDTENQTSLMDFTTLPSQALYQYIIHHNLVPAIHPTPLGTDDPPPPVALLDPARMASRAPTPAPPFPMLTAANRPRRGKDSSRRRSTRLIEEESRGMPEQAPVLADVAELHGVLATLAQRHFVESSVKEVDVLTGFMGAVRARTGRW